MGEIRFGIIGLGTIAGFHLEAIRALGGARIAAVASRRESEARAAGERNDCAWTTDYRQLLRRDDVDVVCVTTSSGSHGAIGIEALDAGKHVVVEKPLAMTAEQAERMVELAAARGLLLSVVSQRRFETQHQAIKRVVQDGKLGRLLMAEVSCPYYRSQQYYDSAPWRGTVAEDGGALMNQAIHSIDLLLWLADAQPRAVFGAVSTQTHRMEAEDIGLAVVRFASGALGRIFASTSIRPGFAPTLALYGEKGTIVVEGAAVAHWTVPGEEPPPSDAAAGTGGGVNDPQQIGWELHRRQLEDVIAALCSNRRPAVTGEDGLSAVRLIEAIYRSAQTGRETAL